MIRKKFFDDPVNGYAAIGAKATFDQMWVRVLDFENKTGLSLDDGLTREQYVDLFNSLKIRHTSSFSPYKMHLVSYVRYLVANGHLPKEQEDIAASITTDDLKIWEDGKIQYYKNINQLYDNILDTISCTDCYDDTQYDLPAAILYLAWYGLTEDEIIEYHKSDVLDDGIIIYGEKVEPPFKIMQQMKRLRDSDGYYQQARGVIFHAYTPSDYLIRTEHSDHVDLTKLRGILSRFNKITDRVYSLSHNVVRQSGIFYRAYMQECNGSFNLDNTELVPEVFCERFPNKSRLLSRIRDYRMYKQLFY